MKEQWKHIVDKYYVSNTGKVKSYKQSKAGKLLKPSKKKDGGHLRVILRVSGKSIYSEIQTLVARAFIGEQLPGMVVRHLDGNPENNDVTNLKYGTPAENHEDAANHGRKKGRQLAQPQINLILLLREVGYEAGELANMFNISKDLVYKVFTKKQLKSAY